MDDLGIDLAFEAIDQFEEEQEKTIISSSYAKSELTKITDSARSIIGHKYDDDILFHNDSHNLRDILNCTIM